jgi:hypothetical protein
MRKTTITLLGAILGLFLAAGITLAAQGHHQRHRRGSVTGVAGNDPAPPPLPCTGGVASTGDDDDNPGFTNGSFSGTYADSFNGPAAAPVPAPNAITGNGVLTADGNGNVTSGTSFETVSDGTNICQGTLTGTYAINADGTGAMCLTFTNVNTIAGTCTSPAMTEVALVIESPRSISTSEADASGLVISGHLRLQRGGGEGDDD